MSATLTIPEIGHLQSEDRQQVAWDRLTEDDIMYMYTLPLEKSVSDVLRLHGVDPIQIVEDPTHGHNSPHAEVDIIVQELTGKFILHSSALPERKYGKKLKPYWSLKLTELSKNSKLAPAHWLNAGKPTDKNNTVYKAYKEAKLNFRAEQRRSVDEYESQNMKDIEINQDIDQKFFWFMVNKHQRTQQRNITNIRW